MKSIQVPLYFFSYDKKLKQLSIASEYFGMPKEFFVTSHHTGRTIRFVPIGESHRLFSQDQWDGEQMIYEPAAGEEKCRVETAVVYHEY